MPNKQPANKMQFYEAYSLIESVQKMTGNPEFERLKTLVKECEEIINLGREVFQHFPEKDDDHYYNSRPQTLREKVTDRLKTTSAFMAAIRRW